MNESSLDHEYLHLFVPVRNMRALEQEADLDRTKLVGEPSSEGGLLYEDSDDESFIEVIAKIEAKRTIGNSFYYSPPSTEFC